MRLRWALVVLVAALFAASGSAAEAGADPAVGGAVAHQRPFLGVHVSESPDGSGLQVLRVVPYATAAEIGLREGDLLTALNGRELKDRSALADALQGLKVGQEITVDWIRDGAPQQATAPIQAQPRAEDIRQQIDTLREQVQTVAGGGEEERSLAGALDHLGDVLGSLPDRLQQAAEEFKLVYPEGEFTLGVSIRISSTRDDEGATIDLSPRRAPRPMIADPKLALAIARAFLAGRSSQLGDAGALDERFDFAAAQVEALPDEDLWSVQVPLRNALVGQAPSVSVRVQRSSGAVEQVLEE